MSENVVGLFQGLQFKFLIFSFLFSLSPCIHVCIIQDENKSESMHSLSLIYMIKCCERSLPSTTWRPFLETTLIVDIIIIMDFRNVHLRNVDWTIFSLEFFSDDVGVYIKGMILCGRRFFMKFL